jgi:hypothetical protein
MQLRPFKPFRNQWPAVFGGSLSLEQQIAALFANDEQGAVYDPSDLSTLYTEWEGTLTTQSTVGGVVGTMLDKSGNDNHAQAPSDAARPLLGREPEGGRRNLLLASENITAAAWDSPLNVTRAADQTEAPDGQITADLLGETTANNVHAISQTYGSFVSGQSYTLSVYYKKGPGATAPDWMQLTFPGARFGTSQYANFNISTGVVGTVGAGTAAIANAGNGWYRCSLTASCTSSGSGAGGMVFNNNSNTSGRVPAYAGATTSNVYVWGAQVELGALSNYQRVGASSSDVTEAGKRDCFYLFHDLDDDKLQVTLPDLGSNVTIATGDNDGVAILTGQTVGAGVYDLPDAKSKLFGHLIIDRALTVKETAAVTEFLTQKVSQP